jgi:hypothetical protein
MIVWQEDRGLDESGYSGVYYHGSAYPRIDSTKSKHGGFWEGLDPFFVTDSPEFAQEFGEYVFQFRFKRRPVVFSILKAGDRVRLSQALRDLQAGEDYETVKDLAADVSKTMSAIERFRVQDWENFEKSKNILPAIRALGYTAVQITETEHGKSYGDNLLVFSIGDLQQLGDSSTGLTPVAKYSTEIEQLKDVLDGKSRTDSFLNVHLASPNDAPFSDCIANVGGWDIPRLVSQAKLPSQFKPIYQVMLTSIYKQRKELHGYDILYPTYKAMDAAWKLVRRGDAMPTYEAILLMIASLRKALWGR